MDNEEKKFRKHYREMIESEIDWAEIRRDKSNFVESHFAPQPFFLFRPLVYVPALSFCLVLALALVVAPEHAHMPDAQVAVQTTEAPAVGDAPAAAVPAEKVEVLPPNVMVKSVSSDVGTTMIYQQRIDETPLTVVWVFPNDGTPPVTP